MEPESVSGRESNFQKAKKGQEYGQGVEYDYRSVMHYSAYAFSRNNQPTILPKVLCETQCNKLMCREQEWSTALHVLTFLSAERT
jgi:hypothetical protein